MISISRATDPGQVMGAGPLFDEVPTVEATRRFLSSPGHHLLLGYADELAAPVGFISGVEMTHPDKGTEMFVYELGVDAAYRRRGVGTALVSELAAVARDSGCFGMWVLTDSSNQAALATYRRAGAPAPTSQVMATWTFDRAR